MKRHQLVCTSPPHPLGFFVQLDFSQDFPILPRLLHTTCPVCKPKHEADEALHVGRPFHANEAHQAHRLQQRQGHPEGHGGAQEGRRLLRPGRRKVLRARVGRPRCTKGGGGVPALPSTNITVESQATHVEKPWIVKPLHRGLSHLHHRRIGRNWSFFDV